MARPRTSAVILEMRGAFKKNPQRRRYPAFASPPLSSDPPPEFTEELQEAWHEIINSAPAGVLRKSDRQAVRIAAQLQVFLNRYDVDEPMYARFDEAMWRYRNHLGLTPMARTRFT